MKVKSENNIHHVIRKDRENPGRGVGGGVAILIRKDIKFTQLDTSEFNEELHAISFESD